MITLENNNGQTYKVLAVCGFNKVDKEYYGFDTYRIGRYGLLRAVNGDTYVVADGLNSADWNNGTYFEDFDRAISYYEEKVAEYLGE